MKMIFDQVVRLLLHGLENSQSDAVKAKIREEVSIREKTIKRNILIYSHCLDWIGCVAKLTAIRLEQIAFFTFL